MHRPTLCSAVLSSAVALGLVSCSSNPSVKPVPPPAAVVGKWRHEVKEGDSARTSVYHFSKDGRFEVDIRLDTPGLNVMDLVKGSIVQLEGDKITLVDLSRTSKEGVKEVIPPERRRTRTYQFRITGDELHLDRVDDTAGSKPLVLKQVKE